MAAVGASGGPRIISCMAQIVAALATGRVSLQEAVEEPRLHAEISPAHVDLRWPDGTVDSVREAGFEAQIVEELPDNRLLRAPERGVGRPHGTSAQWRRPDPAGRRPYGLRLSFSLTPGGA